MKQRARKPAETYEAMADAIERMRSDAQVSTADIAQGVGMSLSRFEHVFLLFKKD